MSTRPALAKPALLGLSGGLLIGALYLAVRAVMMSRFECDPSFSSEECSLEADVAAELSKLFYFSAIGMLLVGLGVFILFRPRKEAAR